MTARIDAQVAFLNEADRLKSITRATPLCDASRYENSAEHSWQIALYALVLGEHADPQVRIDRVIRMLLIHDIVEIDAGDAPVFGEHDASAMAAREEAAAKRLFGLLPEDQAAELIALWREFEANETPDAQFAKSIDRFQTPNQNMAAGGGSWRDYNVSFDTFLARVGSKVANGAPKLWHWLEPRARRWFDTHSEDARKGG
ncbi:HD domain-containing protein [Aestuariicoccus sp. MJ-SS9]|uniref:HD domain-containing protein n=1 Tax=Aestuariicoccus sp. MJ-SS9 TaxID=3079855 RepID=UPI002908C408|nr:HD domain-containing protein [Aestuariicoccus sp. MJ-SS9]MDU8911032.1 HD domain-containing protein [Aestuariicoccus sp. MJ-SS9]